MDRSRPALPFLHRVRVWFSLLPILLAAACMAPCDYSQGDDIPLTLRQGLPVATVQVNGNRVPFLLDTGATVSVMTAEGTEALRLPEDTLRTTHLRGIGGSSSQRNTLLGELRIGQRVLRNLTLPVVRLGAPLPVAGVIGADFLRISEVEIDVPARRAALHDRRGCRIGALPWREPFDSVPVQILSSGHVILPVEVNGRTLRAVFDTGATATMLDRDAAESIGIPAAALADAPVDRAFGVGETVVEVRRHKGVALRIGNETIPDFTVGVGDRTSDNLPRMVIGQDYIASRRFWLSYAEQRLYIQPGAAR